MTRLLAFLLLALPAAAAAQSLTGTWHEAASGLTYEFNADGSGRLVQGASSQPFTYRRRGRTLTVQGANGTFELGVRSVTATRASFSLPNGSTMELTRAAAAPAAARGAAPTTQEGDVMVAVRIAEFVTGAALSQREVDGIRREVRDDYASDAAATAETIAAFRSILTAASQATDPVAVGLARQQLLVTLLEARRRQPNERSPFFDAITRRVRLVAYDAATQTGTTNRDVEAALDYMAWMAQLSGGAAPSAQARRQYEAYVAQHFARLPQADREFLSAASIIWPLVQSQWSALSAAQQRQARSQVAAQTPAPATAASMQDLEAYYRTMSQISATGHRTSMNILNNIGGGSDYEMWQTDAYGNPTYRVY